MFDPRFSYEKPSLPPEERREGQRSYQQVQQARSALNAAEPYMRFLNERHQLGNQRWRQNEPVIIFAMPFDLNLPANDSPLCTVTSRYHFLIRSWVLCGGLLLLSACSVHYYDKKSGTEHLWGFGHMKMKATVPNEEVQAVVRGTESLGFHIGAGQEDYQIGFGWDYRRKILISSNTAVRLEWPNGDFFNVRVGTAPPLATKPSVSTNKSGP